MKKHLIALAAGVALVATLGLAACTGGNGGNDPQPTPDPTPAPSPDPTPTPTTSVTVSDLYNYTGVYKDPSGTELVFVFILPKVEGPDTDYIYDINSFVAQKKTDFVDPAVDTMQKGGSPGYFDVEYQAKAIGNMISMIMTWRNQYDNVIGYQTWLIKADGTKAETADLFAAKGVTEEQVLAKVREQIAAFVQTTDGIPADMAAMVQEAYDKTMSEDNINGHMPYYINDEGHLAVAATVYTIAGAGKKVYFLDLGF